MKSVRFLRVQSEINVALKVVFLRLNLQKIVISKINLSPDFRHLQIEVNNADGSEKQYFLMDFLQKKTFLIVNELKKLIKLRNFPRISFVFDRHFERIKKTEELFKIIQKEISEVEEDKTESN